MKRTISRSIWSLCLLALGVAFMAPSSVFALAQSGIPQQPQEANAQQIAPPRDPIAELNLTPEQRQKIRAIREESKDERAAINRRVREAQLALRQALDADSPNEVLIEQRAREAGEAQAASLRLRALNETRIRRILTPEQVNKLKQLLAQAQQLRREQRLEDRGVNGRGLQKQRNGILPGRRNNPLRRFRP